MGLNWIRNISKQLNLDNEGTSAPIERILFIGFEKIYSFHSFDWTDWEWRNAADYEVVFVNSASLYLLLLEWRDQYSDHRESFSLEPFEQLQKNLSTLKEQLLKVINSQRQIFVFAIPHFSFQVQTGTSQYGLNFRQIGVYDWCPLPFDTQEESGEISRNTNKCFVGYKEQLKKWIFYFDLVPKALNFSTRDLSEGEFYATLLEPLFVNLSHHALGIELRYGVHNLQRKNHLVETFSGPIYLLHFPIGGDVKEAIRSLLIEFCNTDLPASKAPDWIESVLPPRGKELDEKITILSSQIDELSQQRSQVLGEQQSLEHWRKLLFETGDVLEGVVLESLKLLGLEEAKPGPKGSYDIVGKLDGETLIFEVKGLTKSAGRDDIFSLDKHIREYETQNAESKIAKGILVVNAFRNDPPDNRGDNKKPIFTGDAISHNNLLEFVLLDTRVLYRSVCDVIEGKLSDGKQFLRSLRQSKGVYSYVLGLNEGNDAK